MRISATQIAFKYSVKQNTPVIPRKARDLSICWRDDTDGTGKNLDPSLCSG
jgi:hypothetical protein